MNIVKEYIANHPEAVPEIRKAMFAYNIEHFRMHPNAHNFPSSMRWAKCVWCDRSRELVRWDELPPECEKRPEIPEITEVLLSEEKKAIKLIERAEFIVKKHFQKHEVNGNELAFLKQTHGITPDLACDILGIRFSDHETAFVLAENEHSTKGRASFTPQIIKPV